ncbi:S8 family peptidase [Roseovarius sp. D22-M7]|uniref:S8 family peptidase n=1 Tax=Roseovarius sp. D22-M7 TaxID=3127116 RepID=UPI00300FE255
MKMRARLLITTPLFISLSVTAGLAQSTLPATSTAAGGAASGTSAGNAGGGIGLGAVLIGGLAVAAGGLAMAGAGGGDDGDSDDNDSSVPGSGPDSDPGFTVGPRPGGERDIFQTSEYNRNWALSKMNVAARYADGGTGHGTRVAIFDSGADVNHSNLSSNINRALSYTYADKSDRRDVSDSSGHGTHMSSVIGGVRNSNGSHGVAFDTEMLIFQGIDFEGPRVMGLLDSWADATFRSIDAGAVAINHSWTFTLGNRSRLITDFESARSLEASFGWNAMAALNEAVENDLVMIFAGGNDGQDQIANHAGMAYHFPEMADHALGVVNIDKDDKINPSSNRCGIAKDFCIAAPGTYIHGAVPGENFALYTGTSPAAAHVSGAVAVLKSNFPELTGAEITTILKNTARDIGAAGIDEIYGHGAIDLLNAVAPQGDISIQTTATLNERAISVDDSHFAAPAGLEKAITQALSRETILLTDGYDRGYDASLDLFVGTGLDHDLASERIDRFVRGYDLIETSVDGTTLKMSLSDGSALPGDPFARLFEDARSMSMRTDLGATTIDVSTAFGHDRSRTSGTYASFGVTHDLGAVSINGRLGITREANSFLGSHVSGAFGDLRSETAFASIGGEIDLGGRHAVSAEATWGRSEFAGSRLLRAGKDLRSNAVKVGYSVRDLHGRGDRLTLWVGRDISLDGGTMTVAIPTSLVASENGRRSRDVRVATQSIKLGSSRAPIDLELRYETPLAGGRFAVGARWQPEVSRSGILSAGYSMHF